MQKKFITLIWQVDNVLIEAGVTAKVIPAAETLVFLAVLLHHRCNILAFLVALTVRGSGASMAVVTFLIEPNPVTYS